MAVSKDTARLHAVPAHLNDAPDSKGQLDYAGTLYEGVIQGTVQIFLAQSRLDSLVGEAMTTAFEQLDFLYTPSRDVAGDLEHFVDLGAEVLFAIEGMGTRVAAVRLGNHSPLIMLADHLDGVRPILVFRVSDLQAERTRLNRSGGPQG